VISPSKKAVLLFRVSDPKQEREGLSLDNQEQALRKYAEASDLNVIREFRFQESADDKIRKRFEEVINFVKKRDDVTCIVGFRVDRMTRNFRDHVLLDDLRLNYQKELHFVHDRLVITQATVGKDIQDWDTKVFLAKMALNRLKEDAIVSAAFKLSRGEWPMKGPFGYINIRKDNRSAIIAKEPEASMVREIFSLYSHGGYSMEQVRAKIEGTFGVTLAKGKLDHILKNSFYYGEMRFKGKLYQHIYEPLISRSTYEKVREIKASFHKKHYKFAGLPFSYRGLIRCAECGCMLTPEQKFKPSGRSYAYYHCTQYFGRHGATWVNENDLTAQFRVLFDGLRVPHEKLQQIAKTLEEAHRFRTRAKNSVDDKLHAERQRLQRRGEVLYEDRLDGLISKEDYLLKKDQVEIELRRLDRTIQDDAKSYDGYYQTATALLEVCSKAGTLFEKATPDERRVLLSQLVQNCIYDKKRLLWELKEPFKTVFSFTNRQIWLPLTEAFLNRKIDLGDNLDEIQAMRAQVNENQIDN
jgi:DNA invertase Pin-like site-specific DNA recombinase